MYKKLFFYNFKKSGSHFILTVFSLTATIKNQRMVHNLKLEHITYHILDILHAWVAKLHYIVAVNTN